MSGDQKEIREQLEWLKRETKAAADCAHKAMWYSLIAAICGFVLILKAGGLF